MKKESCKNLFTLTQSQGHYADAEDLEFKGKINGVGPAGVVLGQQLPLHVFPGDGEVRPVTGQPQE